MWGGLKKENWNAKRIRGQIHLFIRDSQGVFNQCGGVWVPTTGRLRQKILEEAHKLKFLIHMRATKMYRVLKLSYWWPYMKRKISRFVKWCQNCQKVKAKNQRPHDKMQPLLIPMWKWEEISMDFITKLPRTTHGVDSIWVIVN